MLGQIIFSFLSSFSCAALFSAPRKSLIPSGFVGMVGWMIYYFINNFTNHSIYLAAFLGSLAVSILGELSAKIFKKPATVFIMPGLLPLVPGAGIYYTMLDIVNDSAVPGYSKGLETLLVAIAIAFGIIVSSVFSNSIRRRTN